MKPLIMAVGFVFLLMSTPLQAADPNPRIKELQQGLTELGYDPGPVDGFFGPKTRDAIAAFQRDRKMEVDGKYSGVLLFQVDLQRRIAKDEATPEGQRDKKERERLLAMSDRELSRLIRDSANGKDAERILILLGAERGANLPISLVEKFGLPVGVAVRFFLKGLLYPDSKEGIKQFQTDIGAEVTGEVTFGQWEVLSRRWTRTRDTRVYAVTGRIEISVFDGWARVEGTWIIETDKEEEKIAYPINMSKITCRRDRKECDVINAYVDIPHVDHNRDHYYLVLNSQSYEIISWTKNEIVAQDSGLPRSCRIATLTLNLSSNEVYEVTRNNETRECRESYFSMPRLDKPQIARLISGSDETRQFWKKRGKITGGYNNPRAREEIKTALEGLQLDQEKPKR